MRLTVERDALEAALGRVGGIVERRCTIPILANVRIVPDRDGVTLTATDLDIEMSERVAAQVDQTGSITAPAGQLGDFVRALPSGADVLLETGDGHDARMVVKCARSRAAIPTLPAGDFPAIAAVPLDHGGEIDRPVLRRLFSLTAHAMSTEETRYYLNGVYLNTPVLGGVMASLVMVATDGHRMACAEAGLPEGFAGGVGVIVPAKTAKTMAGLLEGAGSCELRYSASRIQLTVGEAVLSSKVIDGAYPDYERVIPRDPPRSFGVDPKLLAGAVKRVAAFNTEKVRAVKLSLEPGSARLWARGADSAEATEQVEVDYDGAEADLGFNSRYLTDLIPLIGPRARFGFDTSADAMLITDPDQPGVRHVLMPIRV